MTEAKAHLEQGKSQLMMYRFLVAQDAEVAPEAHALHFLQMATENVAKAVFLQSNPGWDKFRHAAFASIPHHLRARHVAKTLGWADFGAYKRFLTNIMTLCSDIERLHPQVGAAVEHPNVEYPWPGRDSGGLETWFVPAAYPFGLLDRLRRSLGTQLVNFLDMLIGRFDRVF